MRREKKLKWVERPPTEGNGDIKTSTRSCPIGQRTALILLPVDDPLSIDVETLVHQHLSMRSKCHLAEAS